MFGLNSITMWIIGGMLLTIATLSGAVWWLDSSRGKLQEEKGQLQIALDAQKLATQSALDAVDMWKKSSDAFQKTLGDMVKNQQEAIKETRRLNETFSQHDLGKLAKAKPKLVQDRINSGSADMRRMLESASGGSNAD